MADGDVIVQTSGAPRQPGTHGAQGGHLLTQLGRHNDILVVGGVLLASIVGGYILSKTLSKKYGERIGLTVKDPVSDPTLGQPDMSLEGDMIDYPGTGTGQMTEVPNLGPQHKVLQSGARIDLTDIDYYDLLREKFNNPGLSPRPFGYGDRVVNNSPYYSPFAGGSPYGIPGGYPNPFAFNARRMSEEDEEDKDESIDDETASMIASDRSLEDVYGVVNSKNADAAEADEMMTGEEDAMFMTPDEIDMYEGGRIETAHPILPIKRSIVNKGGGWNDMVDDRFNSMILRDENGVLIGLRNPPMRRKGKRRRHKGINY